MDMWKAHSQTTTNSMRIDQTWWWVATIWDFFKFIDALGQCVKRNYVTETGKETKISTHVNKMPKTGSVYSTMVQDMGQMTVLKWKI